MHKGINRRYCSLKNGWRHISSGVRSSGTNSISGEHTIRAFGALPFRPCRPANPPPQRWARRQCGFAQRACVGSLGIEEHAKWMKPRRVWQYTKCTTFVSCVAKVSSPHRSWIYLKVCAVVWHEDVCLVIRAIWIHKMKWREAFNNLQGEWCRCWINKHTLADVPRAKTLADGDDDYVVLLSLAWSTLPYPGNDFSLTEIVRWGLSFSLCHSI